MEHDTRWSMAKTCQQESRPGKAEELALPHAKVVTPLLHLGIQPPNLHLPYFCSSSAT